LTSRRRTVNHKGRFLSVNVLTLWLAVGLAAGTRTFTVDDYFKIQEVSAVRISPDGTRIAFVRTAAVPDEKKPGEMRRTHDIYLVTLADDRVERLTTHEKGSSSPAWSPNGGSLAFLSGRTDPAQIWLLDMKLGGEARQLTDWKGAIEEFAWSPDGRRIAFVSPDPKKEEKEGAPHPNKDDPYVITRTKYLYDGEGYFGNPREFRHIWVVSLDAPGNPIKVTDGPFDDREIDWSPDGKLIAFVSNRTGDDDNNDNSDIWTVSTEGGEVKRLTTNRGSDTGPRFSPDGKWIAYTAITEPNNLYNYRHLFVIPSAGGAPRRLGAELDREMSGLAWSGDGSAVFGLVADQARVHIDRFSLGDGKVATVLAGECRFDSLDLARAQGVFAFAREDNDHPAEVFTAATDGRGLVERTFLNKEWLADLRLGRTEKIQFKDTDGLAVAGFLLTPPDFDPGRTWPLILKIHGGPQGTDGNDFTPECQWYAANGFIVLRVNYRGSSDYGEAWMGAIRTRWYEKEFDDLMSAVDAALTRLPVDPKRLYVTGVSYGGIMTNWIVTHTARFRAAVSERSTVDNFSSYGVDDCAYWYEKDFGLPYREANFALYRKTSPITYIENVRTPILLMQCLEDHRCPLPQALQFYMGLKKLGKAEAELVLYPREPHGIRELSHQRDRLVRVVDWFTRHAN
jgi:dipeptidyl aminopeptidase/acylaminoacyl peptidase